MGVINVDFKKNLREMGEKKRSRKGVGVDWRGKDEALDKHEFFFLLTARYLLAGKGLDFPMS